MTVLCDLDGVIYRGDSVLAGVPEALRRLAESGVEVFYITNNSTRTPAVGAEKISRLTGVDVSANHVLSSSLSAVALLGPEDGPVLVVGEDGVHDAVERAGLETTEDPVQARTVMVGLDRGLTYRSLSAATTAVRNGARFIATNVDATFPAEDGLVPGAGAIVAAIAVASDRQPEVAGKPHQPMRDLIRSRGVGRAWVIGDRLDTDVALADTEEDWTSILVLTGVTDGATIDRTVADHVVADFPAAVDLVLAVSQQS